MKLLYYRIYYTIYRGLIWLGQSHETDMIRFNVVVIITIFTMLLAVGVISFLIGIIGKSIIVNSKLQSIIFALVIISINVFMVFYKKRYKEIEGELSSTWAKNKPKNVLLTLVFIVCSIAFLCLSIIYIKEHPLSK